MKWTYKNNSNKTCNVVLSILLSFVSHSSFADVAVDAAVENAINQPAKLTSADNIQNKKIPIVVPSVKNKVAEPVVVAAGADLNALPNVSSHGIVLYVGPSESSDRITAVKNPKVLQIVDRRGDWFKVTSSKGFPVWVEREGWEVVGNIATLLSQSKKAYTKPDGVVVGTIPRDITVLIVSKNYAQWYQVLSPKSFTGWVKGDDYNRIESPQAREFANNLNNSSFEKEKREQVPRLVVAKEANATGAAELEERVSVEKRKGSPAAVESQLNGVLVNEISSTESKAMKVVDNKPLNNVKEQMKTEVKVSVDENGIKPNLEEAVEITKLTGWVSSGLVNVDGKIATVRVNNVNFRSVPATDKGSKVLKRLSKGQKLTVVDVKSKWYKVSELDNQLEGISEKNLSKVKAPQVITSKAKIVDVNPVDSIKPQTKIQNKLTVQASKKNKEGKEKVQVAKVIGWVSANLLEVDGEIATVKYNNVNFRTFPATNKRSKVLKSLYKDQQLKVLGIKSKWYQVSELKNKIVKVSGKQWFFQQEKSNYTLQLASFTTLNKDGIKQFLTRHKLKNDKNLHRLIIKNSKGDDLTVFYYGVFDKKADALSVKDKLNGKSFLVRQFADLRKHMCTSQLKRSAKSQWADYCKS